MFLCRVLMTMMGEKEEEREKGEKREKGEVGEKVTKEKGIVFVLV